MERKNVSHLKIIERFHALKIDEISLLIRALYHYSEKPRGTPDHHLAHGVLSVLRKAT